MKEAAKGKVWCQISSYESLVKLLEWLEQQGLQHVVPLWVLGRGHKLHALGPEDPRLRRNALRESVPVRVSGIEGDAHK